MAAGKKKMEDLQAEMNAKLSTLTEQFQDIQQTLRSMKSENDQLKATVLCQADEIAFLKNNVNEREQYARSWSMRCLNIPLPQNGESDTRAVMTAVFNSLIKPILEGAKSKGEIAAIPACSELIEMAHVLPAKGTAPKPVIVRFYSRFWRNLVFRHRKEFAPREESTNNSNSSNNTRSGAGRAARMKFPFYEDLTRATFKKLCDIKQEPDIISAWTVNGTIRFRVKDNNTTFKVSHLFESVEEIVK